MHERTTRQLFSVWNITLIVVTGYFYVSPYGAAETDGRSPELEQELQAALLSETAVLATSRDGQISNVSTTKLDKIAGIYDRIIDEHQKNVQALNAYAEYLWRVDRYSDAMAKWEVAELLDPRNPVVLNHLGGCQLAIGKAKEAGNYFERAARLEPSNALYQFDAGNSCFLFRHQMSSGGDGDAVMLRSLDHFRLASELQPFNIDYARAYAETFYAIPHPDWSEAVRAWTHYLKITDQRDFAYSNLARVNLKLGNNQEARSDLGKIESKQFDGVKEHLLREVGTE